MTTTVVTERAVSRKKAASMYGVSLWTIDCAITQGLIKAKRAGEAPRDGARDRRRVLIDTTSLAEWFDGLEDA